MKKPPQLKKDRSDGFWSLNPLPTEKALGEFYQKKYYSLIRKGRRAPEIRRIIAGGAKAEREQRWLKETLYLDIAQLLQQHAPNDKVLDVGCGTGDLVAHLKSKGFRAEGIEPSVAAVNHAKQRKRLVHHATLDDFACTSKKYGAILLMNVLEHVLDPASILKKAHSLLARKGILVVRVPNDFSPIQLAAQKALKCEPWWVTVPDHIHYFNFKSLESFLATHDFRVLHMQGDFPMEWFLLMGENYVRNPALGSVCHGKRVAFEQALPSLFRQTMYRNFAQSGLGRTCLMVGQKRCR